MNCVPQGSVLGPIGFLISINDIHKCELHGNITLFANDACSFYEKDNLNFIYVQMKHDIEVLMKWFSSNGTLLMNLNKTEYIFIINQLLSSLNNFILMINL